jgi:branched-chain amino acid transport system substrate-binding protein
VDGQRVGVLLPLQGKFAKFGQPALEAIELGLGIFGSSASQRDENAITLAIRDAGETTESALAALDRLVKQDHVVAVIGPLMSKGAEQIAAHAQDLGVPLVSLARAEGPAQDWVFQAGLTLRMQAEQIARYAIQQLGMKRFVILQQRDKAGDEAARRFWDAVEKLGGQIVGIESYGASETDFRQQVDKLSGLFYPDARQRELEELAQQRKADGIKKRNRKTEPFYSLKPVVDYDAVFVPDDPDHAKLILPTFAYRDVDHVKFLGTSNWNTPDFPAEIGNAGEQTVFVDAFFSRSSSLPSRQFIEKLALTYSRQPEAIEAIAYDAARVVDLAWRNGNAPSSRAEMRDRLRATKDVLGVTGKISYAEGELGRDLRVLTVQKGQIVERHTVTQAD